MRKATQNYYTGRGRIGSEISVSQPASSICTRCRDKRSSQQCVELYGLSLLTASDYAGMVMKNMQARRKRFARASSTRLERSRNRPQASCTRQSDSKTEDTCQCQGRTNQGKKRAETMGVSERQNLKDEDWRVELEDDACYPCKMTWILDLAKTMTEE